MHMENDDSATRPCLIEGDASCRTLGDTHCVWCAKPVGEPDEYVHISLGVWNFVPKDGDGSCGLYIGYHDAHAPNLADKHADLSRNRQRLFFLMKGEEGAEGLFCSVNCLRRWLNRHVDLLELEVDRKHRLVRERMRRAADSGTKLTPARCGARASPRRSANR